MKFSIRDLMFVTVIVAVFGAWYVDRQNLWKENERLQMQSSADTMKHATQVELMERYLSKVRESYEGTPQPLPNSFAPVQVPPKD